MALNPHVHENLKAIQKALSNYDMSFLSDDEEDFCPLCLEPMDITDKNFKPCPCGYQICQFCYNNIRQNEELNGRCPACRRKYDDDSVEYVVLTTEELKLEREKQARKEWERKQREKERKESEYANRKHLAGMRVIQKNLVYVVGINPPVPYEEVAGVLKSDKYFGQYGKISKIVVNRKTPHAGGANDHYHSSSSNGPNNSVSNSSSSTNSVSPGYGVYITFSKKEDAARCIAQVDGTYMDGRLVKAAYGTTKYCSSYLRGLPCPNPNCMFLHEPGEEADSFNRKELGNKQAAQRTQGSGPIYRSGGHFSGTSSPAAVKVQLHHDHHQGTGSSTPVLTPAPVPTGSNPWGVSNNTGTPMNSVSLSKNSSAHNLPTLGEALGQQHHQAAIHANNNSHNSSGGHNSNNINDNQGNHSKKKHQDKANGKDHVDLYDALGSAVTFLDQRINWFSHYKNRPFRLEANLVDEETYKRFPSLFSWDNLETSEESDQVLTRKLVDILAINPVDYSASVISFLQNASASTNLSSSTGPGTPFPPNIHLQQQAPPPAQHQQRPLNVNTPPPPGMFTPQHVAVQQQQQQHQQQPMPAENSSAPNSADFLNQLINGRRVAAGN
ncbi:MOT2 (YER068W) [Zygosaccharomyces parabailii]|uniref:ZYBA0S04-03114g1_1 n=1 Tax=Zygosaccharomyces bailii (strain CLIB 213 / ATCC 58445 / CBS 680 / BCRC 21525 / NBRC 1098 / NCYC 1416 / NRRL Y-2227) TaxID=1333698 RepID=A0A8J2T699_ZYGB2|nr:MOT2 (YER068W) [Zygosaccharomyces parabailii]CDF89389.1 ZYBA0S04-03114g1_1 [Zygosaccharomyces bailii CLIB 213]CDH08348.1 probable General negative regulator of transcription subunit 4 [Zygosaccharomyces bailii ISA1307]